MKILAMQHFSNGEDVVELEVTVFKMKEMETMRECCARDREEGTESESRIV